MAAGWDVILAPWHLDEHMPSFPVPAGTAEVVRPPVPGDGTPLDRMTLRNKAVADAVARVPRPLLLSGDCTASIGAVAGLQRRPGEMAVVWLDAHGDFNTPAITITGYLGGMALAMLTGCAPELDCALGLRPVADGDVVLADARDLDPAERDALAASRVRRVPADPDIIGAAVAELGRRSVYLHVDVDVIDGPQLPGVRFPVDGGPTISRIEDCLAAVAGAAEVTAACLACTWLPERINDQQTRTAITRLAAVLGARLAWPEPSAAR